MRVLVCDDIADRQDEVVQRILDAGQPRPEAITGDALSAELTQLFKSARQSLADPKSFADRDSRFHDVDLVILDNNLTHLPGDGPLLTAESIAGYIRTFTNAKYVVSLNANLDVDFDLRFLVGDFSSRADLALNTPHLTNPSLWSGNVAAAVNGFLPWYWPRLEESPGRRRAQIEFVTKHLDDPIMQALGFESSVVNLLSLHAKGALSPVAVADGEPSANSRPIDKITFRDVFIAKDRSLPIKADREMFSKSEEANDGHLREVLARVVAADIDMWFRRDITGPQEALLDIPHLLMRFPFFLGERVSVAEEWNKVLLAGTAPYGLEEQLYEQHLAKARFEHDEWVKTACFRWPVLRDDEDLNKRFLTIKEGDWPDVVFCEDRSQFIALSDQKAKPVEFTAEFEGSWARRYIARIDGVRYAPLTRLAE